LLSEDLLYKNGHNWLPLPSAYQFLVDVGRIVGTRSGRGTPRIRVAISLPILSFSAVFVALGVVVTSVEQPVPKEVVDWYFDRLCSLERGTELVLRQRNRALRAVYDGWVKVAGESRVRVRVENADGYRRWELLNKQQALCLEIRGTHQSSNLPARQKGRSLDKPSNLLKAMVGPAALNEVLHRGVPHCSVIGTKSRFNEEVDGIRLRSKSAHVGGKPRDVIRVRESPDQTASYSTVLFSSRSSTEPPSMDTMRAITTVFDGATGFLTWRHYWRSANWIILLDRTESRYWDAVEVVNQEYVQYRVADEIAEIPHPPSGMEIMVYHEEALR